MYKLNRKDISPLYRDVTRGFGGKAGGNFLWTNDTTVSSYVIHSGTAQGSVASYLNLLGASGDYASTPDSSALSIFDGRMEIQVLYSTDDWTPTNLGRIIARMPGGGQNCFDFGLLTTGVLHFRWSEDGTIGAGDIDSTVATGFTAGTKHWVRAILLFSTGQVTFDTSEDGVSWTQLGDLPAAVGATSIFDGNQQFGIGANNTGTGGLCVGKLYRIRVYNGIGGTLVADFNPNDAITGASSFVSVATGETYTINGSAALSGTGPANRIVLASTASETDDAYNDMQIILTGGTGSGQDHQRIMDYDGGSKVAILSGDWVTAPDATTAYQIIDRRT